MNLLDILKDNKGTVSSALGKELAERVLQGDSKILEDAKNCVCWQIDDPKSKNVRAGAAKILEKVAEKRPDLIADDLELLKPAFEVKEPQTRWMLMQVFGYCAELNPSGSETILVYAEKFLNEKAGVCLKGAVHLYLGRIGATSATMADTVLPILDDALKSCTENEVDWILEAFLMIHNNLDAESLPLLMHHAELQLNAKKKSTQKRAHKLIKQLAMK